MISWFSLTFKCRNKKNWVMAGGRGFDVQLQLQLLDAQPQLVMMRRQLLAGSM